MKITQAMSLAVVALAVTGCYAKKKDVQAEFAAVRQEMLQADQRIEGRVTQNAQALSAAEQRLNGRIDGLQRDIQRLATQLNDLNVKVTNLNGLIAFDVPVFFDFGKAELREADRAVLKRFASVVKEFYPGALITAEGFTDPVGSRAYNLRLGKKRADTVKQYLTTEGGLGSGEVRTVSYGEVANRLVQTASKDPRDSHAASRRVVIVLDYVGTAANVAPPKVITE